MINPNDSLGCSIKLKSAIHQNTDLKNTIITSKKENKISLVFQNIILINVHTTW